MILAALLAGAFAAPTSIEGPAPSGPSERPRLVVLLVVDQMRADYLDRFAPIFRAGLRRFCTEGLRFNDARHVHGVTSTGPGHATIATGTHPSRHGIVANEIPGSVPGTFKRVSIDPDTPDVVTGKPGGSPNDMLATALGDWMKEANDRTRVVAIAYKSRSATALGGKHADVCVYVDSSTATFTTSRYYAKEMPEFVRRFNDASPPSEWVGKRWEPRLTDAEFDRVECTIDAARYEGRFGLADANDASFPHEIRAVRDLVFTPFSDERVLGVAAAAIEACSLGADDVTDLLAISFSSADYVGHAYGPESREQADYYAWLDGALGEFLATCEAASGGRAHFVLTSDHGVGPIAESLIARGIDAGRVRVKSILDAVDAELDDRFGADDWALASLPDVYIDPLAIARHRADPHLVQDVVVSAVTRVRGIEAAYPRYRLEAGDPTIPAPLRHSFHSTRGGDVMLAFRRHYSMDYLDVAPYVKANHATQFEYDQRVPMVFLGFGRAEVRGDRFATVDLAPTIASYLGVPVPETVDGRAFALSSPAR